MSFELRPVGDYRPPRYPAAEKPGAPLITNGSRVNPILPLALFAITPMSVNARESAPTVMTDAAPRASAPEPTRIALPLAQVRGLIALLQQQQAPPQGEPSPINAFLSEAETSQLLQAFLLDLGYDVKPIALRRDGVELKLLVGAPAIGVALLDLQPTAAVEELALLKARGEMKVLMLSHDSIQYEAYPGSSSGRLPTREGVVRRLKDELERFLNR
jgi:hypothetical protein